MFTAWAGFSLAAPVKLVDEAPVSIQRVSPTVVRVDFGKVTFGNLRVTPPDGARGRLTVHFGESLKSGAIDRKPPGTVRYAVAGVDLDGGTPKVVAPPADKRNTQRGSRDTPPAVPTPPAWGVVLPFRWVEIEGWPGEPRVGQIVRRSAFASTWDDQAASFESSDKTLDRIWELCRHSIKATTFAGVYVDGDRERIPYEADAYLNQLSHYFCDPDKQMARDTFDHLMMHATWPSEWAPHMVMVAYEDWLHTGDTAWIKPRFDSLKGRLLMDRAGEDGLIRSEERHIKREDIVDWPVGERDGYVFTARNTVVNAFHLHAVALMADMARALGRDDDARGFEARLTRSRAAFQSAFFDANKRLYRDGTGTDHTSLHANLVPLAFGLVPQEHRRHVGQWLVGRGMRCSVYAAQYLMDGLFENDLGREALGLMLAPGDRSWRHMLESGTTITWEAWDQKYKPNQDWNHAWGAAPANLLPRHVLGAKPAAPGWTKALIRPQTCGLAHAKGRIPTPRGPLEVGWKNTKGFQLTLKLPPGCRARLELPATGTAVRVNGRPAAFTRSEGRLILADDVSGDVAVVVA